MGLRIMAIKPLQNQTVEQRKINNPTTKEFISLHKLKSFL